MPVLVDNDANLGALAERWWGAGRDVDDFAYIKVATGVGSGHVIGGELYRGATGVAGEIGHLSIDPQGSRASAACAAAWPPAWARRRWSSGRGRCCASTRTASWPGATSRITAIEDAALAGDALALQVMREAAEYLGIGVAGHAQPDEPGGGRSWAAASRGSATASSSRCARPCAPAPLVSSVGASTIVTSAAGPPVRRGRRRHPACSRQALADPRHFPAAAARR